MPTSVPVAQSCTQLGSSWLCEGLVQVDDIPVGLASAPAQFERMVRGQQLGKALVRIGPVKA